MKSILTFFLLIAFSCSMQGQPLFSKSFEQTTIGPGSVTTLTFTINNNSSGTSVNSLNFVDNLPVGMTVADYPNITTSCTDGIVTALAGASTISFVDGRVSGFSSCTISVDVTSSTTGVSTNTTGDLTSSAGNSGPASANLTVDPNAPGFSKSFSPSTINFGERSTLTFTIDNTNGLNNLAGINFSDNLPLGMVVADPANISIACPTATVVAVPGSSSIIVSSPFSFTPAIPAGGMCTVSVDVVTNEIGDIFNETSNLTVLNTSTFQQINCGKATAELEVLPPTEIYVLKSFSSNPIGPGGVTNIDFTINNYNRTSSATNITFTDDLDAFLTGALAIGLPLNNVCGTGSVISGTNAITFSGGTLPPEGTCTFSVPVQLPTGTLPGSYTNTTGNISADFDGVNVTGNVATENLTVYDVPIFTKTFLNDPILAGGTTTVEFTITNTSATDPLTDINFNDNISAFMSGATISNLPAAGSCGASSLFFTQLVAGDLTFVMQGGSIAAGASCTFAVDINVPVNQAPGSFTNTISNFTANLAGQTVNAADASDDLTIISIPTLTKQFTDDPVLAGDIVNLEFTITHDAAAGGDASAISFTDDLNAVIPGLAAIGLPLTDVCGVGSTLSGTTNLSFTGGNLVEGSSCTFSVPVQVPAGTTPGSYTNTTSALTSSIAGITGTANPATDDLEIAGLELTKEFIDGPYLPGELATLRFTLDNTSTFDATSILFTDNLGAIIPGLVAEAPLPISPCGATTFTGTSFLIYAGGVVTAGTTCTFDVPVRIPLTAPNGSYVNTTSNLTAFINGGNVVLNPATASFEINNEFIQLTKTFTDDPVVPGGTVTLEYTLTNLDPLNQIDNIAFTNDFDGLFTGLAATGLPLNDICGIGSSLSGTGIVSFTGGSLAPGASCTFSVTLQVPASIPNGTTLNCATSAVTGDIGGLAVTGAPASDDLQISSLVFEKSMTGPVAPGETTTITFTITNIDPTNTYADLEFTDDLDAFISGMVATGLPATDVCGAGAQINGTSMVSFSRGILAPGESCSFDVEVVVPCNATAGMFTNTTSSLTSTSNGGVTIDPSTADLEVTAKPTVTFSAPADLCIDAGIQTGLGSGAPVGGVYSGTGVTDDGNGMTYSFNPAIALAGPETITYTFTDSNGCADSATDNVEVFALPVVTFTALTDLCVDAGIQTGLGGGSPTGGVYSGTGVIDDGNGMTYSFNPATAGAGTTTITYDFTDANGCMDDASDDVEIFALPIVSFTALTDLCVDAGIQTGLGGGSPTGGVYSGTGVIDDGNGMTYSFNPATAGAGTTTITYDFTDANGCMDDASDDVEVFTLPIVSFTALTDVCIDAGVQTGLGGGLPTGGVYSGTGVTDDGNGLTYSFNPATAGVGVHTITYDFTDGNACMDSASDNVEVFALPIVSFSAPTDVCVDAGVQTGLGGGLPTGGVYSGAGITDDGNGMTYSFDPATAGAGTTTITYDFTDANGCMDDASDDIEIFALPIVSFTAPTDVCIDAGVQTGLTSGLPSGGVYSGTGVTDDGNGMTFSFDPFAAGVGVHTITYDFTDGNTCMDSASDDIEVFALPIVSFTAPTDVCVDAGVQTGLGGGLPTGGVYSGTGVTDDGNGLTYSFNPATAGVGVHTITYDFTDGNACMDSASDDVEVFALPIVSFTAPTDVCVDAGVQTGLGGGLPTGGVYSGAGITDDGNGMTYSFDPATAGVGTITITYEFTDINGCMDDASDDIEIFDLPMVTFTAPADLCIDAGVQTGLTSGLPSGGVYSGTGVTDDGNGMTFSFDPFAAGVGVHTITYDFTDGNTCMDNASDDIEVFALPIVSFTAPTDVCVDAGVQTGLGGGTPAGGVYSGTGVTDDGNGMTYSFDPAIAMGGTTTISYTFADGNGCMDTASDNVEVFALPIISFAAPADLCIDAGIQTGLGNGTPTGGVYSGTGVTDDGNGMTYSFNPIVAGTGLETITYEFTDSNGCMDSVTDDVEIFALPVVSFTAPLDVCVDGGVQTGLDGGSPAGGVYSGTGITDDGNGMTYSFNPAIAGVGVHAITYNFTDTNGCMDTATDDVEVFQLSIVTFAAPADLCLNAGIQTSLGGGSPSGGVYSGLGVTDDGNGMTFSFDPTVAMVGITSITYNFTDSNGCMDAESGNLEIFEQPTCIAAEVSPVTCSGLSDGVASVTGSGGDGSYTYAWSNGETGPMASMLNEGLHSVEVTDGNGCVSTCSVTITTTVDLTPPMFIDCQLTPFTYELDGSGMVTVPTTDYFFGATDNCSASANILLAGAVNDFSCSDVGSNIITLTITDEAGNTATCGVEIIIEDEDPNFTPTLTSECSMIGLNIDLNDFIDNGATGVSYSWLAVDNPNVVGETLTATNGNIIADVITNTSGNAEIISYTITPTSSNGCEYAPFDITVEIYSEIVAAVSCGCAFNAAGTQIVPVVTVSGLGGGVPTTDGSNYSFATSDGVFLSPIATLGGTATMEMTLLTGGDYTITITDDAGCELVITDSCLDCSFDTEFTLVDPCSCNGDQSENGAMDGTFDETVQINGPAGFTLLLGAGSIGMLNATVGDVFTEVSPGVYESEFDHLDNVGYTIFADILLPGGAAPLLDINGDQLTVTNACQYPILDDPFIDQIDFCISDDSVDLTGATTEIQGHPGTINASINGAVLTNFNPETWGPGLHTIQWTFIGDFVSNQGGTTADPAIPGNLECATYVTQDVRVHSGGQLACNGHINVSVDQDCGLGFFTADMFMEGASDDQFFNFQVLGINNIPVELNNQNDPNYIGNYVGQTLTYEVFDACSGNNCWGLISLQDKIEPTIACDCETPYLADGVTPNPDCSFNCYEVWDLELLEEPGRNNELLPEIDDNTPEDNCINFGDPAVALSYADGVNCGETIVTRQLTWTYVDADGITQYLTCTQNFLFDNLETTSVGSTVNGAWDGYPDVFTANAGDRPLLDVYTPEQVVLLSCGADPSPEGIALAYDIDTPGRPAGIDRDDHVQTPNIVEHNEGYAYAYPYVVQGGWAGRFHAKPIDNNICNIYTVYTDLTYDTCADDCYGNSKIARTWTILDWCNSSVTEFVQTIKRVDNEGPAISGPDHEVGVDPWGCFVNFEVPAPEHLSDNCDKDPTWSVVAPTGITVTNGIAENLPKGTTTLTYVAEDCCGNVSYASFNVTVVDRTAPTAIALQNLVIQLTNEQDGDGVAKLYAIDVDNESHDGCGPVHFEIRRNGNDWCNPGSNTSFNNDGHEEDLETDIDNGAFVLFCCEDAIEIDDNGVRFGIHDVILRVWDDGDMDGVFGSAGDNYNEIWTTVRVEDKQAPVIVCPAHIELDCNEDFNNYDLTGRPFGFSTCGDIICDADPSDNYRRKPANSPPFVGEEIAAYNPSCRRGAIQRTWSCEGKTCTQWIIMRDTEDGDLEITWPQDQTSDCLGFEAGEPTIVERLCELTGTNLQSDTFYFEDGACYKILNHWSVINWCDYDADDTDLNDQTDDEDDGLIPGLYTHTQVLKLIDTEKPTLTLQDTCFAVNTDCIGEGIAIWAGAADNGICASAWLKWEVEIDMNSDWIIDYTYSSWYPPTDDFYLAPTGGDVHVNLPDGLPNGCASRHRARWTVSDGCGNDTQGTSFFTIEDKKQPTPYMIDLSTALMENGSVELWAKDFNAGSFDNCTPEDFLVYTFSSALPYQLIDTEEEDPWYDADGLASQNDYNNGDAELWDAAAGTSAMVFNSDDLADAEANGGILNVPVYVWDLCGNHDFALVNLKLIDNDGNAFANIGGRVATENGAGVGGVILSVKSEQIDYAATTNTLENGEYAFNLNPMYSDYAVSGEKNDDWLEGVTTLDLVLIQRHILGLSDLDSPYKMIAADANNDERISAIDLIQLRKLILGIYNELPSNNSWRFTDAQTEMDTYNPWPFSELIEVSNLEEDMLLEDFIGIKIGDVNGSALANVLSENNELRSKNSLMFDVKKSSTDKNETILKFNTYSFDLIAGFQFTLELNMEQIIQVDSGLLEMNDANVALVNGALVISWNSVNGDLVNIPAGGELFSIKLIEKSNNEIVISDRIAKAEAYHGGNLDVLDVLLIENDFDVNHLYQNEPNPWRDQTNIDFSLSQGGLTTISFYDLTGKLIHKHVAEYLPGNHNYVLKSKQLNTEGVLYYVIENGDFVATKKMILVN